MKFYIQGHGPPVLLIHGLPTSGRLWDYVVPILDSRFTCIVVDLPGLGESPPFTDGSLDPDRYAKAIEDLRQQLSITRWHLIGHDAGATIAVHYATQFSDRVDKVVLCSPPVFPEHQIPWVLRLVRQPIIGILWASIFVLFLWHPGFGRSIKRPSQTISEIIEAFRRPFTKYKGIKRFIHLVCWGDPAQVLGRTAELLPGISASTLILHGTQDGAIPSSFATRAATVIPNARVHLLANGHFLPLSCPEALCKQVLPFLNVSRVETLAD